MSLAVVIPCYNEEHRLPRQVILDWAQRRPDWFWLLVDDGSTDDTGNILRSMAGPNVEYLALPSNVGKAEAVRQGLQRAYQRLATDWLCYLDADLATPLSEIERLYSLYVDSDKLFILGCRLARLGATIRRLPARHYLGRVGGTIISLLLGLPTYDTQCGAKLVRRELVPLVFDRPCVSRWLFDVELLARCRNHFGRSVVLSRVVEEPLREWNERPGSKLRLKDLLRIPGELWCLHRLYNQKDPSSLT